jgi:hypothetical protein
MSRSALVGRFSWLVCAVAAGAVMAGCVAEVGLPDESFEGDEGAPNVQAQPSGSTSTMRIPTHGPEDRRVTQDPNKAIQSLEGPQAEFDPPINPWKQAPDPNH